MLALAGVGVGDAETDEASTGVELLEPGGDGEAEIGVGGVEVGEVGSVVAAGEEDALDDLVDHQAAQDFHPHRGRPFFTLRTADEPQRREGGSGVGFDLDLTEY